MSRLARKEGGSIFDGNRGSGFHGNQQSLFGALQRREIRGAIVDTWYTYPSPSSMVGAPGSLAFETLDNLVMTPHAAGWTDALETRRVETVVRNVHCYLHRKALTDVVIDKRSAASECL